MSSEPFLRRQQQSPPPSSQQPPPPPSSQQPPPPPPLSNKPPLSLWPIVTESDTSMFYSFDSKFLSVASNDLVPAIHLAQMGKETNNITVYRQNDVTTVVTDYLGVSKSCFNYCVAVTKAVKDFNSKLRNDPAHIRESIRLFQFPESCSSLKIEAEHVLNRTSVASKCQTRSLKRLQRGKRACNVISFIYLFIAFIWSLVDMFSSTSKPSILESFIKLLPIPALVGAIGFYLDGIISDINVKIWVLSAIKTTLLGLVLDLRTCDASQYRAVRLISYGATDLDFFEKLVEDYKQFFGDGWLRFTDIYPHEEYHKSKAYILAKVEDLVKLA